MPSPNPDSLLETIVTLAVEIGQRCPDCADHASRIASLAGQIRGASMDRGAVQDVLDAEMADSDLSDLHVRTTTEAVLKAGKGAG